MPINIYVLDFDMTITNKHTKGYKLSALDIHRMLRPQDKDYIDSLNDMVENPVNYINESFFMFLDNCLKNNIPIKIATAGPISNALHVINRGYIKWCQNSNQIPCRQQALTEDDVVGAGTLISGRKVGLSIDEIDKDCKLVCLQEIKNRVEKTYPEKEINYYFIDDSLKNIPTALDLGMYAYTPIVTRDISIQPSEKIRSLLYSLFYESERKSTISYHAHNVNRINFINLQEKVESNNIENYFAKPTEIKQLAFPQMPFQQKGLNKGNAIASFQSPAYG
ncbi:MAG: hypothetical protein EP298_05995 [Gammaproteobacteria bacterium]|nr:MAG: hypothetical protein EP298_05995 [Gammaproteobacteria bacterium]UTW41490.1 hypothetical protein KFE69_08180 [bacterium SCSIO 12844]